MTKKYEQLVLLQVLGRTALPTCKLEQTSYSEIQGMETDVGRGDRGVVELRRRRQ